eukprot:TRINITY_DN68290_c0_g1_i1.p1 TRINITY_DN68290_c0_g1~~TRINITY_DN68290_c0_g1_i1.p1  ORF type:complete len:125 (+),score=5.59 TRINITY_DN68290_c0_g1_i1:48-377(+)
MALFPLLWFQEDMHQRSNFLRKLSIDEDANNSGFHRKLSEDFESPLSDLCKDFECSVRSRLSPNNPSRPSVHNDSVFHRRLSEDFEYSLMAERNAKSRISPCSSKKATD